MYAGLETVFSADFKKHVLRSANLRENIIQVVIDEAHAISEWGGDNFQSNNTKLGELHGLLPPNIPFLAPTATCSNDTMDNITTKLRLLRGLYCAPRIPHQSAQNMRTPHRLRTESELFLSGSPCRVRAFYAQTHGLSRTVRAVALPSIRVGLDLNSTRIGKHANSMHRVEPSSHRG